MIEVTSRRELISIHSKLSVNHSKLFLFTSLFVIRGSAQMVVSCKDQNMIQQAPSFALFNNVPLGTFRVLSSFQK
jgi:hypothetical protein